MIGTVVDLVRRGNIEFISGEKRDKIVSFQIPIKTPQPMQHNIVCTTRAEREKGGWRLSLIHI